GLPHVRSRHDVGFVIVNGENAAGGIGITPEIASALLSQTVADVITLGNHAWGKRDIYAMLDSEPRMLRPANYPDGAPGRGYGLYIVGRTQIAVANLMGRVFMDPLNCPFRVLDQIWERIGGESPLFLIDFHAETTSEKVALGW